MWLTVQCPGHRVYGLYVHRKQELGGGGANLEGNWLTHKVLFCRDGAKVPRVSLALCHLPDTRVAWGQVCAQAQGYRGHGLSLEPKAPPGTAQVSPGTGQLLASQSQLTLACFPSPGREGERRGAEAPCPLTERGAAHVSHPGPSQGWASCHRSLGSNAWAAPLSAGGWVGGEFEHE